MSVSRWSMAVLSSLVCGAAAPAPPRTTNTPPRSPVTSLQFVGSDLFAGSGSEVLWCNAGRLRRMGGGFPRVTRLGLAPSGSLVVAGGTPAEWGGVLLTPIPLRSPLGPAARAHSDVVAALAPNPSDGRSATGGMDGKVVLWSAALKPLRTWTAHPGGVTGVAWEPEGGHLATCGVDRAVKLWAAANGTLSRTVGSHLEAVQCLVPQPNVAVFTCASGGDDGTIRIWQPGIGRQVRIIRGFNGSVLALAFSPDGRQLYAGGATGDVVVCDSDTGEKSRAWHVTNTWVHSLAVRPDGRLLATGDGRGQVRLWDPETGKEERRLVDN